MAVLAEAFSVIIKKESIKRNKRHYKQFLHNIADKKTVCDDGVIYRVGFMLYDDAINYLKYLREGLELSSHSYDNKAGDFVLVDMLNGPMVECDWLEFLRDKLFVDIIEYDNNNEDFSIVWQKDNYAGKSCSQVEGFKANGIYFPQDWTPDNAVYTENLTINEEELEIINQEKGGTTLRNKITVEISFQLDDISDSEDNIANESDDSITAKLDSLFAEADKYYSGVWAKEDREKAVSIYEEIIDLGIEEYGVSYPDSFTSEVYLLFDDGTKGSKDYQRCEMLYTIAASKKSALANYTLGVMYFEGKGLDSDLFYCVDHLKAASDLGHAQSSFFLSQVYSLEKGELYDIDKSIIYCELALKGKYEPAYNEISKLFHLQKTKSKSYLLNKNIEDFLPFTKDGAQKFYELAESYVYGIVNEQNLEISRQCYAEIIKLELLEDDKIIVFDRFRKYIIEDFHFDSRGRFDLIVADMLYELLCDFGDVESYYSRSTLFFFGKGVNQDIDKSIFLLEEGRDGGSEECALALINIFRSDKHNLYNINRAIINCKVAIEQNFTKAKIELLPLKIQKENSYFTDVTSLFDEVEDLLKKKDIRVINTLSEILIISQRDYSDDNFISEFYSNIKIRLKNNDAKSTFTIGQYVDILSFFTDRGCLEAANDLGTTLFYLSKRTNDKSKAIVLWEEASAEGFIKSMRNLLKVSKTDEFRTKDIEKYHHYKRLLNRIENPKPYSRPEIKKPNRLFKAISKILGWLEEKNIFHVIAVIIVISFIKLIINLPKILN